MAHAELPSRRDEAWRWSDLRAAVDDADVPSLAAAGEGHIAERLQRAMGGASRSLLVAAGTAESVTDMVEGQRGLACRAQNLVIEPGATLTRVLLQRGGPGVALDFTRVEVKAGGRFRQFVLAEGAKLARIETQIEAEAGAAIEMNGLYLCAAGRHADITSVIRHAGPNGQTRQLVKGAARKGGRGVFQGKIVVERRAQKTDARQHHHGLMLEDGAEIFAKPELMIHADDVQCAHGATAGGLDERALFYMRARGLPEREARAMLIKAFLREAVLEGLAESVRLDIEARLAAWLAEGGP